MLFNYWNSGGFTGVWGGSAPSVLGKNPVQSVDVSTPFHKGSILSKNNKFFISTLTNIVHLYII